MRFNPVSHEEETVVVRFRIPAALQSRYLAEAQEKQMDVTALYGQALAYAAGDDPASSPAKTRKTRSRNSTSENKI